MTEEGSTDQSPPDGFVAITQTSEFVAQSGPFYERREGRKRRIGAWVLPKHTNLRGFAHGGMMLTMADLALTRGSFDAGDYPPRATLSLTAEFARPVPKGSWIEADVEIIRVGKTVSFARCDITCNGKRVAQASGVFRNVPAGALDDLAKD